MLPQCCVRSVSVRKHMVLRDGTCQCPIDIDLIPYGLACRGVYQWMGRDTGPWTSPTDPAIVDPVIIMATKLDIEGGFSPQPFIAYGALYAAPMRNDNMVVGRRDYTYAVSASLQVSMHRSKFDLSSHVSK